MYETKTTLLLSACLFLHARVLSEGNPSVETQSVQPLPADRTQSNTVTSDVLRKTANVSKSVQVRESTPISAVRKEKEASATVANVKKKFETASSKTDPNDAFRDADSLEEQTDAVTAMLQQQLFAPHDGNLILQAVKKLPQNDQTSASVEAIAAALKVRLSDALRKICPYDTHELDTLTLQLADVIRAHGIRQKRPFALFNSEDIRYLTAGLYHVLQETDIQRLIVF